MVDANNANKPKPNPLTWIDVILLIWRWITQTLVLTLVPFLIWSQATSRVSSRDISLTIVIYFVYLLNMFLSNTYRLLRSIDKTTTLQQYVGSLLKGDPKWTLYLEFYEYYHYSRYRRRKVITERFRELYPFYSWRDISGAFVFDRNFSRQHKKAIYIKLKTYLKFEIYDEVTKNDFKTKKEAFLKAHPNLINESTYEDIFHIPGHEETYMLKISDHDTCFVDWRWFLFFSVIIPVMEFYTLFVNFCCVDQEFTIKRVISKTENLFADKFKDKWPGLTPRTQICGVEEVYNYTPKLKPQHLIHTVTSNQNHNTHHVNNNTHNNAHHNNNTNHNNNVHHNNHTNHNNDILLLPSSTERAQLVTRTNDPAPPLPNTHSNHR